MILLDTVYTLFGLTETMFTGIITAIGITITGGLTYLTKIKTESSSKDTKDELKKLSDKFVVVEQEIGNLSKDMVKNHEEHEAHKKDHAINDERYEFIREVNEIITDATKYSNDIKLTNYIIYKGNEIRYLAVNLVLINPKISDIDIVYLRNSIQQLTDQVNTECEKQLGTDFAERIMKFAELGIKNTEDKLIEVINDNQFNNKRKRFYRICEDFIRENLSLTIREYMKFKK